MRILAISLDRSVLDPASSSSRRQALTYAGHEALIVVVAIGLARDVELAAGLRAKTFGGASKFGAFMQAWSRFRLTEPCDVVTAQEPVFTGWLALRVARRIRCALHVQDHSGMFGRPACGWRERLLRPVAKHVFQKADRVRTVSERGKRGLVSIGIPESKIDVIPIATDVSRFSNIDRSQAISNRILCIARLEPEKGVDVLIRAFAIVKKSFFEATLVIVGDGSRRAALESLASALGIAGAVSFEGRRNDVQPYLAEAGLYVQPSHFEGWGIAVIEAAAAGLPIVMTDVGCAGEIIKDGESGLVVPSGDVKALAEAMARVFADGALRRRLAEGARHAVEALPPPEAAAKNLQDSFQSARHLSTG